MGAAFRELVTRSGCNTPSDWNAKTMGAGIIDAQKVLAAALPAGAAAAAGATPRSTMESALEYFPMLEPDVALAAITANVPRTRRGGVRAAFDLGYRSTVVGSATATRNLPIGRDGLVEAPALHKASLSALADLFAVVVNDARDLPE